jgi:DNA-binding CsgD family transcriptional regulator
MIRLIVMGYFLAGCLAPGLAQYTPRLRNFQPSEYAAQNQNWSVAQSTEGWIYVGNNGTLMEFDGTRWRHFAMPEKQSVRAVACGRDGQIFCGGFAEFGFWKRDEKGRLTYTSLSSRLGENMIEREEIWHILVLPDAVLFQSFSMMYKYDYQKLVPVKPPGAIMFAQMVNNRVVVPVIDRGLYELLPDQTFRAIQGAEVLKDKIVQFMVPNGRGGIWAGTSDDGIYEWQAGVCQPWANPLNQVFRQKQLNKAVTLQEGGWAIGTILDGVYLLNPDGLLQAHLNRENGLQNNTVLSMLQDRDGNLWLGLDKGIDMAALRSSLSFFSDQTGSIGTVYAAALFQEKLYIGTNQGVFYAPFRAGSQPLKFTLVEGTQGQVWQLKEFGGQLICGHNSGTFLIRGGVSIRISDITGGWCSVEIPGRSDLLLQATYTGLILLRREAGGSWRFGSRIDGFSEPLKKILFDSDGNLWATHPNRGLYRLRLNQELTQVQEYKKFGKQDGLAYEYQLGLCRVTEGSAEQIVINAQPGAFRLRTQEGRTTLEPHWGKKWIPGAGEEVFVLDSSGLWLLKKDRDMEKIPLNLVPAYENVECLSPDLYLFCLENGFALLNTAELPEQDSALSLPPTVVRLISTTNQETFLPDAALRFPYSENSLEFQFAQPVFGPPNRFSWFLEGFSKEWSPWSATGEKEFTNLPEGRYVFRVRSEIGGAEATVVFKIAPPWYRSVWALGGYGILLLTLAVWLESLNRKRLEQHRQRLETEKEREILKMEVDNKSRELSNAAFNLIRKNEALQSLKDHLIDAHNEPRALSKIVREIDAHLEGDHDWEMFEASFNRVHDDFFKRLMQAYPDLTPGDLRLAAYLKMNLSSKEIAPLLNISIRGIENKRYRLRKKLGLSEDANLTEFIMAF